MSNFEENQKRNIYTYMCNNKCKPAINFINSQKLKRKQVVIV